ncbi:MAG: hypothetical protein ACUVWX_03025 [Kiritimatiellia bacterium]
MRRLYLYPGILIAYSCCVADTFWIRVGPIYRDQMQVEVSGTSHVQAEAVHAAGLLLVPSSVGPEGKYANRTYDDGYVMMDPGTGNPASIDPEVTWYWGYDRASQYNSTRGTLTFQKRGEPGFQDTLDTTFSAEDNTSGWGVLAAAGLSLLQGRFGLDVCAGLQHGFGDKSRC